MVGSVSASDLNDSNENTTDNVYLQNFTSLDIISHGDGGNDSYNKDSYVEDLNASNNILKNTVKQTFLSGNDTKLYYQNGTSFKVILSDDDGFLLANQTIIFTINNVNYTRITNNDGVASIAVNLISGDYLFSSYYAGNENYSSSSTSNTVNVLSTINGENIKKYYKSEKQYSATFVDGQGNFLKDTMVTFNINGIFYERKTDQRGIAKLNINLFSGEYILTAVNPVNGEMQSNKIIVLPTIYGFNIVKYYKNDTPYQIELTDSYENPLINQEVIFNINGIFYTRTTDQNGIARLNINLDPGNYIITATNTLNGEMHSNNIEVLPTIFTEDLSMNYNDGHKFSAYVVDDVGNPLAGSDVIFNINGVFYTRITDKNGDASLNINLDTGTYIITSTNYKGLSISNKINIAKSNSIIKANDAHLISGIDRIYSVILSDLNNKTIPFAEINFNYDGIDVTSVTDKNGKAEMVISNPSKGSYFMECEFKGNLNYNPYKSSNFIVVDDSTSILTGTDLDMLYKDGSKFIVSLTDLNLTPLANKTITFYINNVFYNRTTDENGVASLNINLMPGTYDIYYSYSDVDALDYNWGFNTIVISKLPAYLSCKDLAFPYGENKEFTAVLTDASKNPLEGIAVIFNINYESFTVFTDASGIAKLKIDLPVGYYDITTSIDNIFYYASSIQNHVLVDGFIIFAYDITVLPGLYRDYSVTLLDPYEKPVSNANIEFKYNGVTKYAKTDSDGVATVSVGGLSKGDYLIYYKYAAGDVSGQSYIFVENSVLNTKNTISNLEPYLSSSKNCPVSNSEIVSLAKKLTEKYSNPLDKAIAIFNYVRDSISYSYYYDTYYGAVGTLHAKQGNCVDQAHLSIALYRAAGLPARYVHGKCVFNDGDISGHVWSQVLVGNTWIVSDSINARNTLGQVTNWNNYNYKLYGYFPYIVF